VARKSVDFGITGFDHVDLRFQDRAKARRFFVEQMGLDVLGEGPDHTFLLFGDQVLGLRDAKKGERPGGVDHLALRVDSWLGLRSRITRARIDVTAEKERDNSRSLYLKGPEGIRIELVYRPDPATHKCANPAPPPVLAVEDDDGLG
jgi:catechol-2,3-dioxygenase